MLLVTRELDGLDQAGEIVVLDHGRVAEQGSHRQLRHAGGRYQRLLESDYEPESGLSSSALAPTLSSGELQIPRRNGG